MKRDEQPVVSAHHRAPDRRRVIERRHLVAEPLAAERSAWRADRAARRTARRARCAIAVGERVGASLVDQHARLAGEHRFERAAARRARRPDGRTPALRAARCRSLLRPGSRTTAARRYSVADLRRPTGGRETRRCRRPAFERARAPGRRRRSSAARRARRQASMARSMRLYGTSADTISAKSARARRRRGGRSRCRRADTRPSPRDYSIGGSCPQHNER